jgi:hypothetical protein
MRPVRIHLDTSDYSAMHDAPMGSPVAQIRDKLIEIGRSGRIEIGLSYHVVFELLQRAETACLGLDCFPSFVVGTLFHIQPIWEMGIASPTKGCGSPA